MLDAIDRNRWTQSIGMGGHNHRNAHKTWRTRSAVDISLQMFAIMTLGTALWLLYGIWQRDWPIIGANAVSLALTSAILVLRASPRLKLQG